MATSINHVVVSGNLTHEPKLRFTNDGVPVLNFSLALNSRTRLNEEWTNVVDFVPCTLFGPRAEKVVNLLDKGSHVTVQGRLKTNEFERNGYMVQRLEVRVGKIDIPNPVYPADDEDDAYTPSLDGEVERALDVLR